MPWDRKSRPHTPLERPRCHTAPPCCFSPSVDNFDFYIEPNSPLEGIGVDYGEDSEPGSLRGGQTISETLVKASNSFQSFPGRKPKTKKTARSRRTPDTVDIPSRIFVGGLTPEINEDDLRELFGPFGDILSVYIKNRGSERHRGFAFVTFKRRSDADSVVEEAIARRSFDIKDTELKVLPAFRHLKQYDTPPASEVYLLPPSGAASPTLRKSGHGDHASYPFPPSMSPGLLRQPPAQPVPVFPGAFIPLPYPSVVPYFPYYDGYGPAGFISQFGGLNIAPNRFYNPGFGPPLNFPAYQRRSERASYASADHRGCGGDFQQPSSHFACPSCSERPASLATSVNSELTCCASCSGCDVSRPHRTETSSRKHGSVSVATGIT